MSKGRIFIGLAVVLIPLGIWAGHHFSHTEYQVVGLVQVNWDTPVILYADAHEKMDPAYFPLYIEAQAALLRSARVIALATQDQQWKSLKSPVPNDLAGTLRRGLTVSASGELIQVSITNPDETLASTGVATILSAYMKLEAAIMADADDNRLHVLEDHRTRLNNQLIAVRQQISSVTAADTTATTQNATARASQQLLLDDLNETKDGLKRRLDEVTHRIDALNIESRMERSVTILSRGEPPIELPDGYAHLPMSAFGGATGFALAGLLALTLGSRKNGRAR